MSKVAGMKYCVEALAVKRGISKAEAQSIMQDAVAVIVDKCKEGGVSFKGQFTIKQKVQKGRSGNMNGKHGRQKTRTHSQSALAVNLKQN